VAVHPDTLAEHTRTGRRYTASRTRTPMEARVARRRLRLGHSRSPPRCLAAHPSHNPHCSACALLAPLELLTCLRPPPRPRGVNQLVRPTVVTLPLRPISHPCTMYGMCMSPLMLCHRDPLCSQSHSHGLTMSTETLPVVAPAPSRYAAIFDLGWVSSEALTSGSKRSMCSGAST